VRGLAQSTLPVAFHPQSKLATLGEPLSGNYCSTQLLPLQSGLAEDTIGVAQPLKAELDALIAQLQRSARRGSCTALLIDSC